MSETTLARDARLSAAIEHIHANATNPMRLSIRQVASQYNVHYTTLSRRLANKASSKALIGGQNRVLSKAQSEALLAYITEKAYIGFPYTRRMVIEAIRIMKEACDEEPPSDSFVQKHLKTMPIRKIKWKPMDYKRRAVQDIGVVLDWFKDFERIKQEYNIKPENIYNFDECGFRIACPSAIDVYVPIAIESVSYSYFYSYFYSY
jgi:hypothetical protein